MNFMALNMEWNTAVWAGMAIKGGVVLAVAGLAALLLHRASAAWRHLVWTLALISLPLLTLLSLAGPTWRWPVLIIREAPDEQAVFVASGTAMMAADDPVRLTFAPSVMSALRGEVAASDLRQPENAPFAVGEPAAAIPWRSWLLVGWVVAAGIICLPLGVGLLSVVQIRRTARMPVDGYWTPALERARRDLP